MSNSDKIYLIHYVKMIEVEYFFFMKRLSKLAFPISFWPKAWHNEIGYDPALLDSGWGQTHCYPFKLQYNKHQPKWTIT